MSLLSYAVAQLMPLTCGGELTYAMLDVFVPLVRAGLFSLRTEVLTSSKTGRMGDEAPAENIIATLVAITCSYAFPLSIPFVHRYSRGMTIRAALFLSVLSVLSIAVFSARDPFDEMHQKRLFVIHMENVGANGRTKYATR